MNKNLKLLFMPKYKKKKYSLDDKICFSVVFPYIVLSFQILIFQLFKVEESSSSAEYISIISKIIVAVPMLYTIIKLFKKHKEILIIVLGFMCLFLLSFIFIEKNRIILINISINFFFICLPFFCLTLCISDFNCLMYYTKRASDFVLFFCVITTILMIKKEILAENVQYSMSLTYYLLFPFLISVFKLFNEKQNNVLLEISKAIICIICMVITGSRGAVIAGSIFVFLSVVLHPDKKTFILVIPIYLIAIFNIDFLKFFTKTYNLLLNKGINSRTLYLLSQNTFFIHLSGRDMIYQSIIKNIKLHPFWGMGIGSDQLIAGYAHNFFLELIINFGIIIGGILIIVLLGICYKKILVEHNYILMFWFCIGIIPLLFSGSLWLEMSFWIFLGLLLNKGSNR